MIDQGANSKLNALYLCQESCELQFLKFISDSRKLMKAHAINISSTHVVALSRFSSVLNLESCVYER